MPIAPGMIRKPSTCSLPASLLMEQQGMTPSSSIEGLSPTGSTCSLGMVGHSHHHTPHHHHQQQQQQVRRTPPPSSSRHSATSHTPHSAPVTVEPSRQSMRSESSTKKEERSSVAIVDSAIVQAGPSFHSPPLTSPDSVASSSSSRMDSSFPSEDASIGNDSSENPLREVSSRSSATVVREKEKPTSRQSSSSESGAAKANGPVHAPNTPATGSSSGGSSSSNNEDDREELTSSWKSVGNVSNCSSSWADEAVSSGEAANINRPEWANMSPPPPPNSANNSSSSGGSSGSKTAVGGSSSGGGGSSTPVNASRHDTTPSTNGSSGDSSSNSGHHHHHKSHHHHHHHGHGHHHQSTPSSSSSSSRTVHQIHTSNSLSDIIPIQTHPGHSSPFHSPPSSTSSSSSASFISPPASSSSVSSGPPPPPPSSSSKNSNSQRPTESHSHPLPTSTAVPTPSTISTTTTSYSAAKNKQSHTPLVKRNSSDLSANQSSPILQAAPPPPQPQQVYVGGNRAPNIVGVPAGRGASGVGAAPGGHNWIMRPVLLPNHPVHVIGVPITNRNQHQHQVIHTSNPPVTIPHNGLMRTVAQQNRLPCNTATIVPATFVPTHYHHHHQPGGGGLVVCPPASISHIQGGSGGPPAMCFNCGKRGHLGNSCPGVTMETNNPDSKLYNYSV